MSKLLIENPTKLEKIKPKPNPRRNSTGNASIIFSQPNPIPNYLRASIGSCHDLCKYGGRRELPPESEQNRKRNVKPEARSKTYNREKKASEAKNSVPTKRTTSNPKPIVRKQTNEKSGISREDASQGAKALKTSKKTSSSVKIPSASKKIKKSAENSEAGDLPKKIKHVSQPNPNIEQKNVKHDNQEGDLGSASCSTPNQKEKVDSPQKPWKRAVGVARVVMKESGSSPRKQRMKMEKALGIGSGEGGLNGSSLRVVVDESMAVAEGENTCPDSTEAVLGSKVRISRDKVKALVDSFETQVNIHDFRRWRARRRRKFTC